MESYSILNYPSYNERHKEFKTKTPLSAAKKAFGILESKFDLRNNDDEKRYLQFVIINNKTNKIYKFLGIKIKLKNPRKTQNNQIRYFKNTVFEYPDKLNVTEIKFVL